MGSLLEIVACMKILDYYFYMGISSVIKAIYFILCYNPLHCNRDYVICNYSTVVSITLMSILFETLWKNTQSLGTLLEESPILCLGNVCFFSECHTAET